MSLEYKKLSECSVAQSQPPTRPDLDKIEYNAKSRLHRARTPHIRGHHKRALELCAYIRYLEGKEREQL
jgi:hypothetical protein